MINLFQAQDSERNIIKRATNKLVVGERLEIIQRKKQGTSWELTATVMRHFSFDWRKKPVLSQKLH